MAGTAGNAIVGSGRVGGEVRMTGVSMSALLLQKLDVMGSRCSSFSRKGTGMLAKEHLQMQRTSLRSVKPASVPQQISGMPIGTLGK